MNNSILEPKMIRRQILLIKQNFSSYPSSDEDTEARIAQTMESGIWPLVNHISSFEYPREFSVGVMKLSHFPIEKEEKDKWLNEFAYEINNSRMGHFYRFTEDDAFKMDSSLGEIMNALNAMKKAIPFINFFVSDDSEKGGIQLVAQDKIMAQHNLVQSIGDND